MLLSAWISSPTSFQTCQIYDIFMSAFLPQGRSDRKQLSDYFQKKIMPRFENHIENKQLIRVTFDDEKIVGFAIFERWPQQSYYLAEMAILPDYQRQGIGKKLVFSILDRDQGTKKIVLVTETANRSAQSFYEKIGFEKSLFEHPDYPENFVSYEFPH